MNIRVHLQLFDIKLNNNYFLHLVPESLNFRSKQKKNILDWVTTLR